MQLGEARNVTLSPKRVNVHIHLLAHRLIYADPIMRFSPS